MCFSTSTPKGLLISMKKDIKKFKAKIEVLETENSKVSLLKVENENAK